MPEKTKQMKAGKYELVGLVPNGSGEVVFRQTTSQIGKPHEWTEYRRGDIVDLTAEEAERLKEIIGPPGAAAQIQADALHAQADAAKAAADDAKRRAAEASKGTPSPPSPQKPASDQPAGNASFEEWHAFALTQEGVTEAGLEGLSRDDLREMFAAKA
jgi:hypothetical protein